MSTQKLKNLIIPDNISTNIINEHFFHELISRIIPYFELTDILVQNITKGEYTIEPISQNVEESITSYVQHATIEYYLMHSFYAEMERRTSKYNISLEQLSKYDFPYGTTTLLENYLLNTNNKLSKIDQKKLCHSLNRSIDEELNIYSKSKSFMEYIRKNKSSNPNVRDGYFNSICGWNSRESGYSLSVLNAPYVYLNAKSTYPLDLALSTLKEATRVTPSRERNIIMQCHKKHMNLANNFCECGNKLSYLDALLLNYQLEKDYHISFLTKLLDVRETVQNNYPETDMSRFDELLIKSVNLPNIFTRETFWDMMLKIKKCISPNNPLVCYPGKLVSFNPLSEKEKCSVWLDIVNYYLDTLIAIVFPICREINTQCSNQPNNFAQIIESSQAIWKNTNTIIGNRNDINNNTVCLNNWKNTVTMNATTNLKNQDLIAHNLSFIKTFYLQILQNKRITPSSLLDYVDYDLEHLRDNDKVVYTDIQISHLQKLEAIKRKYYAELAKANTDFLHCYNLFSSQHLEN